MEKSKAKAKKYILIVEDDKYEATVMENKLLNAGYDVLVARNGAVALKLVREKKPDLIILDLILPELDGFDTLQQLKSDENLKDIPVVVLSNLGEEEDIKQAMSLGASDYFVKVKTPLHQVIDIVKKYI